MAEHTLVRKLQSGCPILQRGFHLCITQNNRTLRSKSPNSHEVGHVAEEGAVGFVFPLLHHSWVFQDLQLQSRKLHTPDIMCMC